MAARGFLANQDIRDITVFESSVRVNHEGPNGDVEINLNVSFPEYARKENSEENTFTETIRLVLSVSIVGKGEEEGIEYMASLVDVSVSSECMDTGDGVVECSRDARRDALQTAYGFAADHIFAVTCMTPMRGFRIPNPDIEKLMSDFDEAISETKEAE